MKRAIQLIQAKARGHQSQQNSGKLRAEQTRTNNALKIMRNEKYSLQLRGQFLTRINASYRLKYAPKSYFVKDSIVRRDTPANRRDFNGARDINADNGR